MDQKSLTVKWLPRRVASRLLVTTAATDYYYFPSTNIRIAPFNAASDLGPPLEAVGS